MSASLDRIRDLDGRGEIRIAQHAHEEMVEEAISLSEVLEAIKNAEILEDYPDHRRGACCLLYGCAENYRPLHVVCTTAQPMLIIITVYEPMPPKWVTPVQRRPKQ